MKRYIFFNTMKLFLPYFKQLGFVFKYKLIAAHQGYEAAAISIRKGLFKCTLVKD